MNFAKYTKDINTLTLISSCGCNLECNYCAIAHSSSPEETLRLQTATKQAFEDGTFLQNCKNVFQKLQIQPQQITQIDLWGQEPTLTLDHLTNHLEDWYNYFPNWNYFFFSTNGMAYPERISDFAIKLNELHTDKRDFAFNMQFSYDGEYGTDNIRKAKGDLIAKNLKTLITNLNQYDITNIIVSIHIHGVVSLELIKALDTTEKVENYYIQLIDWCRQFEGLSVNKNVEIDFSPSLTIENPIDASSDDGIALAAFARRSQNFIGSFKSNMFIDKTISLLFTPPFATTFITEACNAPNVDSWVTKLMTDKKYFKETSFFFAPNLYCGTNKFSLKIMYDGALMSCQNNIFDRDMKYLRYNNDFEKAVKESWITHKMFVNPLTDSDEDIIRIFELYDTVQVKSWRFLLEHYIISMYWLARAGQIDTKYCEDEYMLIKHALMFVKYNQCLYNNYIKSGSAFMEGNGKFRMYFNGYMDILEHEYNKQISNDIKKTKELIAQGIDLGDTSI